MSGYREDHERYHKHGPSTDDEPRLSIEELGRAVHEGGFDLLTETVESALASMVEDGLIVVERLDRPGNRANGTRE